MQVFKFGGASVKDAAAIKNVAVILSTYKNEELLVVISAMGKMTNAFEKLVNSFYNKQDKTAFYLKEIKDYHFNILKELFPSGNEQAFNEIENLFVEIDWILEEEPHGNYNFVYDQLVSFGELLSTKIVSAYLNKNGHKNRWVDARSYIQTDNTYREGQVNWEKTSELINKDLPRIIKNEPVITQGFIGGTSENYTTTLGREGSDYSAAIFASCLKASAVTIWKDVPGVLNADPKLFPDAVKYEQLPYSEAIEMTYYGATVIHPKTIKPLQNNKIPLYVKPFLSPTETGTVIGLAESVTFEAPAIIVKKDQLLLSIATKDLAFIVENNLSFIFAMFAYHHTKINMMQNSALSFSVCVDNEPEKIKKLIDNLQQDYKVFYNEGLELITMRHYTEEMIEKLINNRTVLLEQRSRSTVQLVLK